jgi:hypothetical protein
MWKTWQPQAEHQKLKNLGVPAGGIAHDFNHNLMAVYWPAATVKRISPRDLTENPCPECSRSPTV